MKTDLKNYREDIDGIRALAVIFVLLHHLEINYLSAGYIGVDIFFVISGFLITSHILRDIKNNNFNLKKFYLNRFRRIFPALITMLFITTIAAYFLLIFPDLRVYSASLLASILSISNLYFWNFIKIDYFSTDASVLPLLHTWSLGIEEQFYIIWPLFLLFIYRFFSFKNLYIYSIILICISFILYYTLFNKYQTFVFYFPFTRAFELLIGALMAINYRNLELSKNKLINNLLSILGLIMILFSAIALKKFNYPVLLVLTPCIGTALLIIVGKEKYPIGTKILSNKLFVFIGLISYSVYLWHWPIIAFINYFKFNLNLMTCIIIAFITLFVSFLSWNFIEKPFRYKFKYNFRKTLVLFLFIPFLLSSVFYFLTHYIESFGYNKISSKNYEDSQTYFGVLKENFGCIDNERGEYKFPYFEKCSIGDTSLSNEFVILVGDSHAMASVNMIDIFLKNEKIKGHVLTNSGTPFILGDIANWRSNNPMDRNNFISNLISNKKYKYVVLGGAWNYYKALPIPFKDGIKNAIKVIIKNNSIPVIILDNAPLLNVSPICGLARIEFHDCFNKAEEIKINQRETRNFLINLKNEFSSIRFIDLNKIICNKTFCFSSLNAKPLYMSGGNNSHLSSIGAYMIGNLYLEKYGNPFHESYNFIPEEY